MCRPIDVPDVRDVRQIRGDRNARVFMLFVSLVMFVKVKTFPDLRLSGLRPRAPKSQI